jgi:hypothetical protein
MSEVLWPVREKRVGRPGHAKESGGTTAFNFPALNN